MKTLVQTTCLLLVFSFSITILSAQTTSIGARGGIHSATIHEEEPSESLLQSKSRVGIDVAAVLSLGITKDFSIQPELHFIQKGGKADLEILGDKIEATIILNYLEVPVLAKYAFGSESVQGFMLGGPAIGVGLSGKSKGESNGQKEEEDIMFGSDEGEVKRLDYGFAIGGGLGIPTGGALIFVDVRYLLGLANLNNFAGAGTAKNRGVNVSLGILFALGQ